MYSSIYNINYNDKYYVVELITIMFIETAALSFALSFVISSLKKKEVKSIENK